MRTIFGRWLRRLATLIVRFADWIEGAEVIYSVPINLEPEHALKALRDAEAQRAASIPKEET